MQLIEVVDAARAMLNEPLAAARTFPDNTSGFWTDGTLTRYHNIVQRDIMNDLIQVYEEYFVTQSALSIVAGTYSYEQPSGSIKIRRIEDQRTANQPVEVIPVEIGSRETVVNELFTQPSGTNYVGGYYLRGNQIVLTDTPTFTNASAIMVYYIRALPDILSGTSVSQLPEEFHNLLVYGIVKMAQYQQGVSDPLAVTEYERLSDKMRKQAEDRQIQRPRRVKSSGGLR